jgi:allantoin racemase
MKLLLINPNTTRHVTDRMLVQAQLAAGAQAEVVAVTASFGPAIIGSRAENAVAAHAALELAAKHQAGFDAVILGVSLDTALRPMREMLDIPVVGMAEAGLLTACMLGGRIGCLTLGARLLPVYEELTQSYGLVSRVSRWRALELPAAYGPAVDSQAAREVGAACRGMAAEDGADVVLLCAAVLSGYASHIAQEVQIPVIDGIEAATKQAMVLVELGLAPHRTGSYARPTGRRLAEVGPELADWLGPRARGSTRDL